MEMQDKAITGRNCRHYKAMADSPQTSSFDLTWLLVFIFNSLCYIGSLHLFDRMALIPAILDDQDHHGRHDHHHHPGWQDLAGFRWGQKWP